MSILQHLLVLTIYVSLINFITSFCYALKDQQTMFWIGFKLLKSSFKIKKHLLYCSTIFWLLNYGGSKNKKARVKLSLLFSQRLVI